MEIAYYDGKFIDINEKVVPIQERGHQFGDGIYEVIRVYKGTPFFLEEHLDRLERSASAILLEIPYSRDKLKGIIQEGLQNSGILDAEVYLQITRGIAPRLHLFPNVPAVFSMTIKNARNVDTAKKSAGAKVLLLEDERWVNCYIKSLNLLPNVIAKQTAVSKGYDEAILVKDNNITEGSSSNIFVVKNGVLYTTPATKKILHGITRAIVITLAQKLNIRVIEEDFNRTFLQEADEAFITSTSVEIYPISKIDEQALSGKRPVTEGLQAEFSLLHE